MSDPASLVAEFLRMPPGEDGLFRNKNGRTAQPWEHAVPLVVTKSGTEKEIVAAFFEKGIQPPTAEFLICIYEGRVIGICSTEDFRTESTKSGERWLMPHLSPSYAAYTLFRGCEVCGDPRASLGIGFNTRKGIMGILYCSDHAPSVFSSGDN